MKSEYRRLAHTLPPEVLARAVEFADEYALELVSNDSGSANADGWRESDCADDRRYIAYLANRHLVELDTNNPLRWRLIAPEVKP